MKRLFILLTLLATLSFFSCVEKCDCEVLEDGTIECPC